MTDCSGGARGRRARRDGFGLPALDADRHKRARRGVEVIRKLFRKLLGKKAVKSKNVPAWYVRPSHIRAPVDVSEIYGSELNRRGDICKLVKSGGIGIELGVAGGWFSERLLALSDMEHLYSVDRWAGDRRHDIEQYRTAVKALMPHRARSTCLRMTFDEALELFTDDHFDFIYIDGYAHTGQEAGKTLEDWWPKLKTGGLFSGDDYSQKFPLVMECVDRFIHEHGLQCMILTPETVESPTSQHPSWMAFKQI